MKILKVLFFSLLTLLFACEPDESDNKPVVNPDTEYELYIDFWNPDGDNPQIRFDSSNSSPEVRIDFSQTFAGVAVPPNFTNVIIDNVRIIDENFVNYQIEEITAYEYREDIAGWKIDVEFIMEYEKVGDLNVVLVLDASASLGDDFNSVKDYAADFVTKIFTETASAKVGIVDFSDEINSFNLTNNENAINEYVNEIVQGPFTSLYEAMNQGIEMLQAEPADGKAILTFTDGTDNNSDPEYTPEYLLDKLSGDSNSILINSFMIGLEGNGGVDKPVLQNLAVNGGVAQFPNSINELEDVFEKFSESISNVYNFTYIRNQQIIPEETPARLKFVITALPK